MDASAPIVVTVEELNAAVNHLFRIAGASGPVFRRAIYRCATQARDRAVEYAPRSPTVGDIRKATGRKMKIRKARGVSRPKPGGLERSIDFQVNADNAEIFVSAGSEAGLYAFRIHEEKGKTWHHRGVGTISKGAKADDKFIERGIKDRTPQMMAILVNEVEKLVNL